MADVESVSLPDWLQVLHLRAEGETTGEHLCRIVRALDGVSLHEHADHLAELFYASEPTTARAALVASWETNCASSARAILDLAGVEPDNLPLVLPLQVGQAMTVLREGCAKGRLPGTQWRSLRPGWLMVYWSGNGNNAHVEWCLSTPDAVGMADHGGGGRAANAITCSKQPESILSSWGRPLQEIYDTSKIVTNEATGDNPS